jgi:DNA mismatch repair protein MutL
MAVIHVLDKHTAELIAAGEVVERPASVVKELLENAIDAGSTQITVTIEAGGIRLIEVSDNGSGIETEYISTAFIRHATSKIEKEEDLNAIHTLGFRGEALASIASVARVEVLTRTEPDEFACLYRIEGGEEFPIEPAARGVGTTMRVRDLFYNTPARMKFLKKDASEGTFVADVIAHVALSHPEISFKFVREGKLQYVTPGDGDLMNAAYAVLGREFTRGLLRVEDTNGQYRIHGLVTPPKSCRASRSMQYFYINGRYVKNRTMMAGLEGAFKGTAMQGKFPGGILLLEMPVDLVDVNVHPAKTEVRFAREGDVFDVVYHAIKLALAQPGSGERMFAFERGAQEPAQQGETGIPASDPEQEAATHSGLAAVLPDQAAPGTLPRKTEPKADAQDEWWKQPPTNRRVSAPAQASTPEAARSTDVPAYVIPFDAPLVGRDVTATMHSPSPFEEDGADVSPVTSALDAFAAPLEADKAARAEAGTSSFRVAARESVLDIEPDLPQQEQNAPADSMAAWGSAPNAQTPKMPEMHPETAQTALPFADEAGQTALYEPDEADTLHYVGEIFKTYILAQRGEELCVIDKHAAHERQLFEKLAVDYGAVPGQLLLAPVTVNLSAEEKQAVLDNQELLENAGLEVSDFGGSTVVLRTVPADVEPTDAEDLLVELAAKLAEGSRDALNERTEWVLHSIACRAAVKAGDRTSPAELLALAEKILSGEVPPFCPHGRPCVLKLTRKELEKQFGRIV